VLNRIPNSTVTRELKEQCIKLWQNEWETTTKGATTKSFFPNTEDRLKLRINPTPNFTSLVTGHGNIKSYLHKFKIIVNPKCSCNKGEQTVDHIIYSFSLQEQERESLKAEITRSEQWPVSKNKLTLKYYKHFKQFTDSIVLNKEYGHKLA
jgi:hypothetical protein